MNNEEKILAVLEGINDHLSKHDEILETMQADIGAIKLEQAAMGVRLDKVEADVQQVKADVQQAKEDAHQAKEDAHWTRIKIESDIDKKVQILLEGHTGIVETMATKEQLDKLREDLGLERYRIDVLSELQRRAK